MALGDSIIAGVGVETSDQALPSQLAVQLARRAGRTVYWTAAGLNGARSAWLLEHFEARTWPAASADLVVISNGINDVTTLRAESAVLEALKRVVEAAENCYPDALICQLGLPPLGAFPALPQPLRSVLGERAARIDRQLGEWLHSRPASVHLPFDGNPDPAQFARDGYHPAAGGITLWAEFLAGNVADRLAQPARDDMRVARA